MMVEISPPVFLDTVPIGFSPSLCSGRKLASTLQFGLKLYARPRSYRVRVVERLTLWNDARSASAAASTWARCAAVGVSSAPIVVELVAVLMYGASPIALTRPLALTVFTAVLLVLLPATVGTCHVPGTVRILDPAPL